MDGQFKLRFAVAGRTLFSFSLPVTHTQAFRKHSLSQILEGRGQNVTAQIPNTMFWSAEIDRDSADQCSANGTLFRVVQRFPRFLTEFEGDFDGLLAGVSSKRRSTLKRKVRRFAKESGGDICWREYRGVEELAEFFALALPLAEKTYQSRLFDGALPETDEFLQSATLAAESDLVRAYLLFLDDKPAAYLYAPLEEDTLIYAYLGYDPSLSQLSPGTVLQYLVHERLFEQSEIRRFDFTAGDGAHKQLFSNRRYECCDVLAVPDRVRWRLILAVHSCWDALVSASGARMEAWGLKARLRKLFRGG